VKKGTGGKGSYHKNVFYTDTSVVDHFPTTTLSLKSPADSHCYTTSTVSTNGSGSLFYLGGTGHTSSNGCN